MAETDEVGKLLTETEHRAQLIITEAKKTASEEARRIIEAAAEDARQQMIRHGERIEKNGGIQRLIEFPPEVKQAGIALLSYFSEILKQKYPDKEMAVRIEQFGTLVRMTIDTPSGLREVIEQDLATYGEVVAGRVPPGTLLQNERDVLRLQNKLDMAKTELQFEKRLYAISITNSKTQIASLEYQLDRLHDAMALSLASKNPTQEMAALLAQHSSNEIVRDALELLSTHLSRQIVPADRSTVEEAAKSIRDRDPSILQRVYDIFSSTASGAAGNLLASWIENLLK